MRITNRYGLPGAIVEAVKNDDYDPGESDITVTTLIGPTLIRRLTKQHSHELEEDASDRLWSLMGKAVHKLLEASEPSAIVEKRLYMDVEGWRLGGQFDRLTLRQTTLQDYKFASVYELMNGLKADRTRQLNVLAELATVNGYDIRGLEVVHLGRDWSQAKARQGNGYPKMPIQRVKVPLWKREERIAYINERIKIHQEAENRIIPCTNEERWYRGESWAVMKKGRKSAIRLCSSEEKAKELLADSKHYIEYRNGTYTRCESYCPVSKFCPVSNPPPAGRYGADGSSPEP